MWSHFQKLGAVLGVRAADSKMRLIASIVLHGAFAIKHVQLLQILSNIHCTSSLCANQCLQSSGLSINLACLCSLYRNKKDYLCASAELYEMLLSGQGGLDKNLSSNSRYSHTGCSAGLSMCAAAHCLSCWMLVHCICF